MNPIRVFIVDDDRDFVDIITYALQKGGYEVFSAFDGENGFHMAVREKPDLIVLDVMMKTVTEGLRVAKELYNDERTRGIPILMLSALKDVLKLSEDFEPDEANLPIHTFLEKPVPPETLLEKIREAYRKRKRT